MSNRSSPGTSGLNYLGTRAIQPPNIVFEKRDPTNYDINHSIMDLWINLTSQNVWILVSLEGNATSKGELALWVLLVHELGAFTLLEGDNAVVVGPSGGIIDVFGTHGITTAGLLPSELQVGINNAITLGDLVPLAPNMPALNAQTGNINVNSTYYNYTSNGPNWTFGVITTPNTGTIYAFLGCEGDLSNTYLGIHAPPYPAPTGLSNTSVGYITMNNLTTGNNNTGVGSGALNFLTTGNNNIGIGSTALAHLTTGSSNTAVGAGTLFSLTTAAGNVGMGTNALTNATSDSNSAYGTIAGAYLTTGGFNTLLGYAAGTSGAPYPGGTGIITGINNCLIGYLSGSAYTSNESNNILIGSQVSGTVGESNSIRIGFGQTSAYMQGIYGVDVGNTAVPVVILPNGQLGTSADNYGFYVRGQFTPTLNFSGSSVGITYSTQVGQYTKIGDTVYFQLALALSNKGTSTGTVQIDISGIGIPIIGGAIGGIIDFDLNILNINISPANAIPTHANNTAGGYTIQLLQRSTVDWSESIMTNTNFTNTTLLRVWGTYWSD